MKQTSASLVKVTRPMAKGVFPRTRLFQALDEMREKPVVWVSGPPGSGKTTVVSSYLEKRGFPCLWYQVDEGDSDPATFFYYMGLAAKRAAPRKRTPMPLLTPEYLPGLSTFTMRYFENVYDRLKKPCIVVFDNYQEVPNSSPFHGLVLIGLSRIPEGINVFLISRGAPPPILTRLQANNVMEVLDWNELRLTVEESGGIIRTQASENPSVEKIQWLHDMSDGWAAGLVLMVKKLETESLESFEFHKLPREEIFDYFAGEIFDRADEKTQVFFLKTAFFPKMIPNMAETLTGFSYAGRLLSQLNKDNFFIDRRFQSPPAYQYHPLFREFLLSRAKESFTEKEFEAIGYRAAQLLEKADQTEAAIELLSKLNKWDVVFSMIMKHAPTMLAQGRNQTVKQWLKTFPADRFENNPWLSYWMGAVRLPLDPKASRAYFEKAFTLFKAQGDAVGMFLSWSGIVDATAWAQEDFRVFDQWIPLLEELMEEFKTFPSEEIEIRVAASMFTALALRKPHHPDAKAWAQRALAFPDVPRTVNARAQTLFQLTNYHFIKGDMKEAYAVLSKLKQLCSRKEAGPLAQITAQLATCFCSHSSGAFEDCEKAGRAGLDLSRSSGIHAFDHMLMGNQIVSTLLVGDLDTAGNLLEQMAASKINLSGWDRSFYHHGSSRYALARGDLQKALVHADLAVELTENVGVLFSLCYCYLTKALVLHRLGRHEEAAIALSKGLDLGRKIEAKEIVFAGMLFEAQFAFDQGKEELGISKLKKALPVGRNQGFIMNHLADDRSLSSSLCMRALEAGIEVDYVQGIIRKGNLIPDKSPVHLENWPWPLKIYTLGRFALIKNGQPIRFSRKAQKKPLSLLKALITFGGRDVEESRLADALWPEVDGDMAQQSLKTTVHRLRKLLGYHEALETQDGRLTINPRCCWVDVWAFERIIGQASAARKKEVIKKDAHEAVQLSQKAIGLYTGHFLGSESDNPWMYSFREMLRSKYIRTVEKLGHYWEERERWENAIDLYLRALEVDEMAERIYRRLMICQQRIGRRTEALRTFERCRKALLAGLGIEPSSSTEAIRKSILD